MYTTESKWRSNQLPFDLHHVGRDSLFVALLYLLSASLSCLPSRSLAIFD